MKQLTFEKWENGKWFVIYPDYEGDQDDLEMVDGADLFLDFLTTDGMYVTIKTDTKAHPGWCSLVLTEHDEIGGTYQVDGIQGFDKDVWLCNVVHSIFGEHPEIIYFQLVE